MCESKHRRLSFHDIHTVKVSLLLCCHLKPFLCPIYFDLSVINTILSQTIHGYD